jgi:hypothetical protein
MLKFQVRQNKDGVGYYVVEIVPGLGDMYIVGTSMKRSEMVALANKLNLGE